MPPDGRTCHAGEVTLRCLIVDDSLRFLDAARALLAQQGIDVVGVASTGAEALRQVSALRPDVTLVDIDLGGESGFEVIRWLSMDGNPAPMILISTHLGDDYADLVAASPAHGFLSKSSLSGRAIRALLNGGPTGPVSALRGA
jgi:DNA-binding NarL/FixJ family response regulator